MQGILKTRDKENAVTGVPKTKAAQLLSRKMRAADSESTHPSQKQTNVSLQGQEGLYTVVLEDIRHKGKGSPTFRK